MIIEKLGIKDINDSYRIITEAAAGLKAGGIDQWDERYPAREDLENDINAGTAYGFFIDQKLAAYMVLNQFNDQEYSEVSFSHDDETALTIHRLTVSPDYQNRGIAGRMLGFAESYASRNGYQSMRLDAFSLNPGALRIYEKHDYRRVGTVDFRKGKFFVFEKSLAGADQASYRVIKKYRSSSEKPIKLKTGDKVECLEKSDPYGDWPGWILCRTQEYEGWVPSQIIVKEGRFGNITEDYDATEFNLTPGEIIISGKELNGWILGSKMSGSGIKAWAPLNCLEKI